jgi:hypothetical protein
MGGCGTFALLWDPDDRLILSEAKDPPPEAQWAGDPSLRSG